MSRKIKNLVILFVLVFASLNMYAQTEIFPLKKGLHYKYNYRKEYYNWEMANSTTTIDSGFVQYIILDSIKVNDTTTTWNILEKYNLLRRIKIRYSADTLYWISDSTILQLTEITKGFHELKGSLLICYFPLINWYSSVRIPFYRFADTTHKQVIIYYINNPNYNIDSLFFAQDLGLYKRILAFKWQGGITGFGSSLSVQLLSPPVVSVNENEILPTKFLLLQNYPNPFNPNTVVSYQLPSKNNISLKVYDILGKEVATLVDEIKEAGTYNINFDASKLPSGIYFYRLTTKTFSQTKKMVLLR